MILAKKYIRVICDSNLESLIHNTITSLLFVISSNLYYSQTYVLYPMEGAQIFYQTELINEESKFIEDIDSVNVNKIKRNPSLDSAAKYHAMYLLMYFHDHKDITHKEKIDYPNFIEKLSVQDRVNNPNVKCAEICAFSSKITALSMSDSEVIQNIEEYRKKIDPKWIESDILNTGAFLDPNKGIFFDGYKSSPKHWEIINDKKYNQCGSYTILVTFYTRNWLNEIKESSKLQLEKKSKNLSKRGFTRGLEDIESWNIVYVKCVINVTVFSGPNLGITNP